MISSAYFSPCKNYRWYLFRIWDPSKPKAVFIMLNPSTADATKDDATIRCVIKYAKALGCGGVYVVNLFGWRATKPRDLAKMGYPGAFGANISNTAYVKHYVRKAHESGGPVVCAWGNNANPRIGVVTDLMDWFRTARIPARCFGHTRGGQPKHPLYLPASATLVEL